jgi:DNA-binding winged helix-turn-helix (wHTH) protein/Flp pilus assembly protein TadD
MSGPQPSIYEFGEFRIEAGKRLLLRDGAPVALTPKAFDTLLHLVQNRQRIVEKDELMRAIWPDTVVEENNLNQNISTLRRVLGESRGENRYIATIPGKGYRFIADVESRGSIPGAVQAAPEHVTLAVLPFENLSSDPEREYLADGLTEETIAALGQIDPEHLGVIGRTSVMAYKKAKKTVAEIGADLGATYLIESTLRAEGGRFRVTSKLIRVKDQVQAWSASYDGEPASVLNFQRELSAAIAEQIRLRLSPERLTALARRQTRNAEAYDLYLRGRHYWHQLTPPTTKRAVECFSRATQVDPEYALAWSGLADSYSASPINGDAPPLKMWPLAREAAARAVEAEPGLAEAQNSQGFVKFWFDWDWPGAELAFRKAISLDPNYPMAHRMLGISLAHMGRHVEARPAMNRLRELDPLLAVNQALSAQVAFAGRDYAAAVQFARQAIVVDPEFWIGLFQLGQAYEQLGESELALEALNKAARFSGGNSKAVSLRGYLFAKLGRMNEAREVLNTLEAIARERYIPPYAMALVHAGLGEREKALEWLERAVEVRDVHMCFPPIDAKWDAFRSDARFQAVLQRCGFSAGRDSVAAR